MRSAGAISRRETAQTLGFQNAVDRVTVQVGQEVRDHKGEIIERKAGGPPQRARNGPLFVRGLPGQLVRPAGAVLTVRRTALTPLADGLGRDAIALSQER
jgi:hypothetical protein